MTKRPPQRSPEVFPAKVDISPLSFVAPLFLKAPYAIDRGIVEQFSGVGKNERQNMFLAVA